MAAIEQPVTVYALTDPDTEEIRYIGQTGHLRQRYASHLARRHGADALSVWLKDLQAKGQVPGFRILETVATGEANNREGYWISYWKTQKAALLNHRSSPHPKGEEPICLGFKLDAGRYQQLITYGARFTPAKSIQEVFITMFDAFMAQEMSTC